MSPSHEIAHPDDYWRPTALAEPYLPGAAVASSRKLTDTRSHPDDSWVPEIQKIREDPLSPPPQRSPAAPSRPADTPERFSDEPALKAWLTTPKPSLNTTISSRPSISSQNLLEADPFLSDEIPRFSYGATHFDDAMYRHRERAAGLVSRYAAGSRLHRLRLVDRLSEVFREFDSPATYVRIRTLLRSDIRVDRVLEAFELKLYWKEAAHLCLFRQFDKSHRRWKIYTQLSGSAHEISWKNAVKILELMPLEQAIDLLDGSWREEWQYLSRQDFFLIDSKLPDWFYSFPNFVVNRISQFQTEFQNPVRLEDRTQPYTDRRDLLDQIDRTYGLRLKSGLSWNELMGKASPSGRGTQS